MDNLKAPPSIDVSIDSISPSNTTLFVIKLPEREPIILALE